ncbi:MAG: glycosyltransferase family 9 protein [Thermodesulfobacteriota bacterium]
MKVSTQRMIDRAVGPAACRILSLMARIRGAETVALPVKRILLILLSEMGSLTMTWPMIRRLREKYPQAALDILTFSRNVEIIDLIGLTGRDHIIAINDRTLAGIAADSVKYLARMRRNRPELVIDCELFSRISSIYSFFSGAPVRVGFHRHTQEGLYRGNFINRPVLYNPYLHISRQFVHLAEAVDAAETPRCKIPVPDEMPALPDVVVSGEERAAIIGRIREKFPEVEAAGRPMVVLHPGGGLLAIRAWPPEYYSRVAESLAKSGFLVAVTGPPEDGPLARRIVGCCPRGAAMDLTGFTRSLRELLTVFSLSELLITNDGGPGHFAGLISLPSIILYGPETPVLYGSLNRNAVNLFAGWACSPCLTAYNHRNSPCDGNNRCLRAISPETVLGKAMTILEDKSEKGKAVVTGEGE